MKLGSLNPCFLSVLFCARWSLGDDNNNYIDHLRRSQSLVSMLVVEDVAEVVSVSRTKPALGA